MPPIPDPAQLGPEAVWLVLLVGLVIAVAQVAPGILGKWGEVMATRTARRQEARDADRERLRGSRADEFLDLTAQVERLEERHREQLAENKRLREAMSAHREWDVQVLRALAQHNVLGIPDPPDLYL